MPQAYKTKDYSDITGKTFGLLTVLRKAGTGLGGKSLWVCRCAGFVEYGCKGETKPIVRSQITAQLVKSCGCLQRKLAAERAKARTKYAELIGHRFGRLTVVARNTQGKRVRWECVCEGDAANSHPPISLVVHTSNLTSGMTSSCGCLQKDRASIGRKTSAKIYDLMGTKVSIPDISKLINVDVAAIRRRIHAGQSPEQIVVDTLARDLRGSRRGRKKSLPLPT